MGLSKISSGNRLAATVRAWWPQVHFFQDIGYRHNSYKHCPAVRRNNCACDAIEAVQFHSPSFGVCHKRWQDFLDTEAGRRRHQHA
jgi:alpha 1,2-mannosyltransferase